MRINAEVPDQVRDPVQRLLVNCGRKWGMEFYTYILTCKRNTAIYIDATDSIIQTLGCHRRQTASDFTAKYNINRLVWFEPHPTFHAAHAKSVKLKRWRRDWKNQLITQTNPNWMDLTYALTPPRT